MTIRVGINPARFDAYDSAGGTNVNAGATVPLRTERQKVGFTHTGDGEVTVAVSGVYVVGANVGMDIASGVDRVDLMIELQLDTGGGFLAVRGTVRNWTARQALGLASAAAAIGSVMATLNLSAGNRVRVRAMRTVGSSTVTLAAGESGLELHQLVV